MQSDFVFSMIFRPNFTVVKNNLNAAPTLLVLILTITEISVSLNEVESFGFVALK